MGRGVQLIRLLTSVVIMLAACFFVEHYDRLSAIRLCFDHPSADGWAAEAGKSLFESEPVFCGFVRLHRTYAFAVPIAGLLLGILIIWRWPKLYAAYRANRVCHVDSGARLDRLRPITMATL